MNKLNFTKMTGAGNDFIVIDLDNDYIYPSQDQIKYLCDRKYGIGADGLMLISTSKDDIKFKVDFFNADGSSGMLCGNGARCILWYAYITERIDKNISNFLFAGKIYSGQVIDNELIKINLDTNVKIESVQNLAFNKQTINGYFVDVGSLHFVVEISELIDEDTDLNFNNIDDIPVYKFGQVLRKHNYFAPNGVNVNFIQIVNKQIYIRTFERGVEDETLACGTGSVSSALVTALQNKLNSPITLITKSGEKLVVDFEINNTVIKRLSLMGPAKAVFSGQISI